MAVEITRRGINPKDRVYNGSCSNCKTEIKCLQNYTEYHSDQRDGDYRTVTCPVCNGSIYVKEVKTTPILNDFNGQR